MALETYRQLTKGGGLTIPRLLRQEMGCILEIRWRSPSTRKGRL